MSLIQLHHCVQSPPSIARTSFVAAISFVEFQPPVWPPAR